MPPSASPPLGSPLDPPTAALVRLSAMVAGGDEGDMRDAMAAAVQVVPAAWIEELVLQTYLFAGFPRALNAAREWRRLSPPPAGGDADASAPGTGYDRAPEWRLQGEATCSTVYGQSYEPLRRNIRQLHPALDTWMIVEGYGKVLSRPGLDLPRRELCVVAACAHTGQERQLHSHLHGAVNAGAPMASVDATFDALAGVLDADTERSARMLWARVRAKHT